MGGYVFTGGPMSGLELRISPGIHRRYRVALVEEGSFETLSEHDEFDDALAAMKATERACAAAARRLQRITA